MKRVADLAGPTPYTGEDPQIETNSEAEDASMKMLGPDVRPDYTVAPDRPADSFNWAMSGTHVMVGDGQHGELFQSLDWGDPSRPHAYGKLDLLYNWDAQWSVTYTNMSHHMIEKRLKKYTRDQGWEWGGLLDADGMPSTLRTIKQASVPGIGEINPGLKDWKRDEWSGTDMWDNPADNQSDFYGEQNPTDDSPVDGLYTCSECGYPCKDHNEFRLHTMREHIRGRKPPTDPQPVVDLDDVLPANWNEAIFDTTVERQSRVLYQLTRRAGLSLPKQGTIVFPDGRVVHWTDADLDDGIFWVLADDGQEYLITVEPQMWGKQETATVYQEVERGVPKAIPGARSPEVEEWYRAIGQEEMYNEITSWQPPSGKLPGQGMLDDLDPNFWETIDDPDHGYQWPKARVRPRMAADATNAQIPGPIPFIYDIETDRIFVGHPGERHSDIQGRFTPGGIVQGLYDPKGNVQIRTDTDMPYTVRHMAELWYALHPELEIKGIYLLSGEKKYRLASANIAHKVKNLVAADAAAWRVFQALAPYGNVYAVGGAVRDVVLGKTPKDIDLMVQGMTPEEVESALKQLPGRVDLTGESFGVFRYRDEDGSEVEVALPRTERSTGPGHRDFEVFTDPYISVEEDLARRDFTGNAMAVNLATGDLVDPYRGSEDLKSGVLRTVSDRSFLEDPLRVLRAFSQVSRHGLQPASETWSDLGQHAEGLKELPAERLQMELDKIISGDNPAMAVELMDRSGVLQHVLPEVAATSGFDQKNPHHNFPLDQHLREVLTNAAQISDDPDFRWAALLHDIGKPASQRIGEDGIARYYKDEKGNGQNHDEVGAEMARKLLTALKFPTERIDRICHLIRWHMFGTFQSAAGARKFINRVGDEHADDLLNLRQADIGGKGMHELGYVPLMRQYVQGVRDSGQATNRAQLAINGKDLIDAGFKPGPEMGALIEYLTSMVLEDPILNDKQTLLQLAKETQAGGTSHVGNILDPIRDELDPAVFNKPDSIDPDVKPKIIEWVRKKVYTTMVEAGWPDPSKYLNLILTGSLTTYQWSGESDFDISLWVDVERFPEYVRADLVALMVHHCDGTIVPGTTHPLQCFVVDVEKVKKDDLYAPGIRSAYDLDKAYWLILPEKERSIDVAKQWPEHIRYARWATDKMKLLLRYDKYAVKPYWDFLHHQRQRDMRAGKGDYALSNIVYKMLANEGLFEPISEVTGEYIA